MYVWLFQGQTWTCTLGPSRSGQYTGQSSVTIDTTTGYANFTDLIFKASGRAALPFRCVTSPSDYDFTFVDVVTVFDAGYVMPEADVTKIVQLKFSGDYRTVAYGEEGYIEAAVYNYLWESYTDITIGEFNITEGILYMYI